MRDLLGRFIPAPAGNTATPASGSTRGTVHPRACGEHNTRGTCQDPENGSSPRLRGTQIGSFTRLLFVRFIPALAGNTCGTSGNYCAKPVHPRACGEHAGAEFAVIAEVGSSPRLRGTRSGVSISAITSPVHPRACGEHSGQRALSWNQNGSSPRLRGTLDGNEPITGPGRFIPALAGNT